MWEILWEGRRGLAMRAQSCARSQALLPLRGVDVRGTTGALFFKY